MIDIAYGQSPIERQLQSLMNQTPMETLARPEQSYLGRRELIQKLALKNAKVYGAIVSAEAQLSVLLAIAQHYPRSQRTVADLAEAAGAIGKSTADRALVALQRVGLVRRARFLEQRVLVICWSNVRELSNCT